MRHHFAVRAFLSGILGLSLIASACGSSGGGSPSGSSSPKGSLTIGSFGFNESDILAELYGQALAHTGYTVKYKLELGSRKIVEPALEHGDIDLYPGYAASDLEYINKQAGEAGTDPAANVAKLNQHLASLGLVALPPSPAADENSFVVTKATADQYHLKSLTDLASVASQLVLGAPPDCPTNPFCVPALQRVYGITFKEVKSLDFGGPQTKADLENGTVQVAVIFSTDSTIAAKGWVQLADPKHMNAADNVTPIGKASVLTGEVADILNRVDAKLTTADLLALNKRVDIDHVDASTAAADWLRTNGFI